jgi:hypothetical protein
MIGTIMKAWQMITMIIGRIVKGTGILGWVSYGYIYGREYGRMFPLLVVIN